MARGERKRQQGFSYLVVMALVALAGVGLAVIGPRWADQEQREREDDLLRVGALYAGAIASYHRGSPSNARTLPRSLEELTLDQRFIGGERHLRQLYRDPLMPSRPWGLVLDADGGIRGVYSRDERPPLRTTRLRLGSTTLQPANRYADWRFIAEVQP